MRKYKIIGIKGASYGEFNYSSFKSIIYIRGKVIINAIKFLHSDISVLIYNKCTQEQYFVEMHAYDITELGSNLVVLSEGKEWYK